MVFDVVRKSSYKLDEHDVHEFKTAVAEYLNEEDEADNYAPEDISDEIVEEVLKGVINEAFQETGGCASGVAFDNYFMTVSLTMGEDDTQDAVYEAAALVRDKE